MCQVVEQFWIPYDLIEDEGTNPTLVIDNDPQEVSMGTYIISDIDIW